MKDIEKARLHSIDQSRRHMADRKAEIAQILAGDRLPSTDALWCGLPFAKGDVRADICWWSHLELTEGDDDAFGGPFQGAVMQALYCLSADPGAPTLTRLREAALDEAEDKRLNGHYRTRLQ